MLRRNRIGTSGRETGHCEAAYGDLFVPAAVHEEDEAMRIGSSGTYGVGTPAGAVTLRPIEPRDDAAIARIIRENLRAYHLDIPGTAYFDPELDALSQYYARLPQRRVYFVAETAEGELAGGIGMELFAGFVRCGEIQKLYVADAQKGRGIGQQLLAHLEACAKSRGLERLYLETHSCLTAAIGLYEKNGYHTIDRPPEVVHSTMDLFYLKELGS